MNTASFNISVSHAKALLKDLKLFKSDGPKSINKNGVTSEFKDSSQKAAYLKVYGIGIKNFDYDFLLVDDSFFQFSTNISPGKPFEVNYSFYQNPVFYKSYDEYLDLLLQTSNINDEFRNELGDLYIEEYEQFLNEQGIDSGCTMIRYDFDLQNYKPLIHPSSHIHIGNNNSIRIPCSKLITPYRFVLFIIRHVYYDTWIELINDSDKIYSVYDRKANCDVLNKDHWKELEKLDLYLI
jgi:hypothetical protein